MKTTMFSTLVVLATAGYAGPITAQSGIENSVVVIILDDIGQGWLSFYQDMTNPFGLVPPPPTGYPDVPAMDEIRSKGLRFQKGWATPYCSSTRAVMSTGSYSFRTGIGKQIIPLENGGDSVLIFPRDANDLSPLALGRLAHEVGYTTGCFGKWHMSGSPRFGAVGVHTAMATAANIVNSNQFGFDRFYGHLFQTEGVCSWRGFDAAAGSTPNAIQFGPTFGGPAKYFLCEVLNNMARDSGSWIRSRSGPFVCWYAPLAPFETMYNPPNPPVGTGNACNTCSVTFHNETFTLTQPGAQAQFGEEMLAYHALVEAADASIRQVLDALDAVVAAQEPTKRWYDKVTIILVGDNGTPEIANWYWPSGRVKGEVYEGGIRVPFIVAGKWVDPSLKGAISDIPVTVADVFPTIAGMIGAGPSLGLRDGINLQPFLQAVPVSFSRMLYSERFDKNFVPTLPPSSPAIATGASNNVTEWHRAATDGIYKVIHDGSYSQATGWSFSKTTWKYSRNDPGYIREVSVSRKPEHDALDAFIADLTTVQ